MLTVVLVVLGVAMAAGGELFDRSRAFDHSWLGHFAGFCRALGIVAGAALVAATVTA